MDIETIVRAQFRTDTNCSIEDEKEKIININGSLKKPGSRYFGKIDPFFRAIIYHGEMYMCADDKILDWCRETYSLYKPQWFCKYENLRKLDEKLREYGFQIYDTHIYCLPDPDFAGYDFEIPYEIKWYDADEIPDLKEGNPFTNALAYVSEAPDMIAVAAVYEGKPIAMAGASADSDTMWQIGIDVLSGFEHRGIAVCLVTMLKNRILEMGKVPFYGTSESHSNSMDVAIRSGFLPAFTEVFCSSEQAENV